jgi:GAF domain-containing protein
MASGTFGRQSAERLAGTFARIARDLQSRTTPEETLAAVTRTAVEVVPGAQHAAISIAGLRGRFESVAPTDDVPVRVDAIQNETGQGPCLDALRRHRTFLTDDLALEDRWPEFSARAAADTGVRSMLAFRLFVEDDTIGALNLYSPAVGAFDEHDLLVGEVLAAHAAIAVSAARVLRRTGELDEALASNRLIGVAVGIIMTRQQLRSEEALERLKRSSRYLNRKLHDVAAHVVETGALPDRGDLVVVPVSARPGGRERAGPAPGG